MAGCTVNLSDVGAMLCSQRQSSDWLLRVQTVVVKVRVERLLAIALVSGARFCRADICRNAIPVSAIARMERLVRQLARSTSR